MTFFKFKLNAYRPRPLRLLVLPTVAYLQEAFRVMIVVQSRFTCFVQTRFYNVLDKIEEEADKWENWDTSLFVLGFLGSLIVTLGTALSLTNFVSQSAISTISTIVLLVSTVATAVLGIRERLKFRERALQARRTATRLQVLPYSSALPRSLH